MLMPWTRRLFLKAGACAIAGSAAVPRFLVRAAAASPARRKVLVAIFQRGAVDGLSMVPPYGDPGYLPARPTIQIRPPRQGEDGRALDLDGFFSLHPALRPLKPWWDARALAIVHACGSPDSTRSHFDAQDFMETGALGRLGRGEGWLARAVGTLPPASSPFRAVALGPTLPRALRGEIGALAIQSVRDFDVRGAGQAVASRGLEALYAQDVHDLVHVTGRESFEAAKMLRSAQLANLSPAHGADYPKGVFANALRQVAQLIRGDIGLEVAFVDIGGWDTHVGQGNEHGRLATRLTEFGGALAAFAQDLGDRLAEVAVLTMTEFGRTVRENGNRGTDHGHGTVMLVLGGPVTGGRVYGRWPGLAPDQLYDGRDLALTTDFRTLFTEVATHHLAVPASAPLFPGWHPSGTPLGLFS